MWQPHLTVGAAQKYLGLVDALEADIRAGRVAPGDRLPPQRAVARTLDLSMTTVTRAFNEAHRRGLIDARAGGGTVIRSRSTDLGLNNPPQPGGTDLRRMLPRGIAKGLSGPRSLLALRCQAGRGMDSDRQAGAVWLGRGMDGATADRVVLTAGAQAALYAVCHLLLRRGDRVAAAAMTYPGLKAVAAQQELHLIPLAMDEQGILPEAFERVCREAPPQALYVVPTIDNPTTATLPEERRRALAALARRHGVILIEDDPYAPLRSGRLTALADLAGDLTWHIATLSKCATPALRLAYVLAPDSRQGGRLGEVLRAMALTAPPLMGALASRWIADGTLAGLAQAIRTENADRQRRAAAVLTGTGRGEARFAADPHGHHLWLHLPAPWRAEDYANLTDQPDLPVVAAAAFALSPPADPPQPQDAVRVSLGDAPDPAALESALRRLAALLRQPPGRGAFG